MTKFIAEVCSNHNGDLNRALALIDKAADIGCDAVKFQLFRIDSLFAPEALRHPKYREMLHARRQWELPLDWLPVLKARCIERRIEFGVTPFYVGAVEELLPFVDFYKVASYNLLDTRLLKAIVKTKKPVILSTGMATMEEVSSAILELKEWGCKEWTALHCVSSYPAEVNSFNLIRYMALEKITQKRVGWSDHTVDSAVMYSFALSFEATPIEFHLDLDGEGYEYNIGHCWLPWDIEPIIKTVKKVWAMEDIQSAIKEYDASEQEERLWRADPSDGLRPLMEERWQLNTSALVDFVERLG